MIFGAFARKNLNLLALLAAFVIGLVAMPNLVSAQEAAAAATTTEAPAADAAAPAGDEAAAAAAPAFEHFGPDMIVGQPTPGGLGFQDQHTANGEYALWMHDAILMPIITVISLFVLALLLWVIVRYNRRANPVASKTSHNTLIEIIWTVIPVLILVVIAVPSITLLARQYEPAPEDAITIKANGYQWYWGYEYVDNGGFEVISNMLDADEALAAGEPHQLAVDNRMVVPVGVPIRIQTFGKDVIHSFGIPSLWFKLDAVPGRINERVLTIEQPGIYYGQCMELCGLAHGYMPIAIEARTMEDFNAWVQTQPGGRTREQIAAEAAAAAQDAQSAADAAAAADVPAEEEADQAEAAADPAA
ncbi:MAG: cytochrome c oxidase subunit II [Erythrobacter sp.]|nr:cytochrome c oxidase subunit II [Erythrobacter sp.]